ncbi:MAG TPA: zf-HC2 domain-containing protein [Terriglobia bacterium]|nr:zf-HC2 domain-containing protein [Terriglobia bacterium]
MTCKNLEGLITEYLEEALSPPARADFEAHLAACPDCRKRLDETRALIAASHDLGRKINQEWRTHTAGESPEQFLETLQARALGEPPTAKKRYQKLAPAAAAVVVIAIAAGVWFHVQSARRAAQPQNLTIDLSHWLVLRGGEQPVQAPVELKRARLNLKILLPIGSNPHEYQVAISNGSRVLVQAAGPGKLKNGITTVRVHMDCSKLHPGKYTLAIRRNNESWEEYPAIIR